MSVLLVWINYIAILIVILLSFIPKFGKYKLPLVNIYNKQTSVSIGVILLTSTFTGSLLYWPVEGIVALQGSTDKMLSLQQYLGNSTSIPLNEFEIIFNTFMWVQPWFLYILMQIFFMVIHEKWERYNRFTFVRLSLNILLIINVLSALVFVLPYGSQLIATYFPGQYHFILSVMLLSITLFAYWSSLYGLSVIRKIAKATFYILFIVILTSFFISGSTININNIISFLYMQVNPEVYQFFVDHTLDNYWNINILFSYKLWFLAGWVFFPFNRLIFQGCTIRKIIIVSFCFAYLPTLFIFFMISNIYHTTGLWFGALHPILFIFSIIGFLLINIGTVDSTFSAIHTTIRSKNYKSISLLYLLGFIITFYFLYYKGSNYAQSLLGISTTVLLPVLLFLIAQFFYDLYKNRKQKNL